LRDRCDRTLVRLAAFLLVELSKRQDAWTSLLIA
jgi:hypothetical protein